jgi:hypothetical protein
MSPLPLTRKSQRNRNQGLEEVMSIERSATFISMLIEVALLTGCTVAKPFSTPPATTPAASKHPTQLSITSAAPPPAAAGAPYSASLTASGGKTPYTWTWAPAEGSTLPPGLTVLTNQDNSGTISGTPTATGSFDVVIQVSDAASARTTVNDTFTINSPGSLAITSGSPPEGSVGTAYGGIHFLDGHEFSGFQLTAGGIAPNLQTWSWTAAAGSSLPPGLMLRSYFYGGSTRCCVYIAVITGTPTVPGSYDVVVTVTDSASPSTELSANYTIKISGP